MMKGRFFQALHTRWQRKLGAPRPEETFSQLFERARMFEQLEKQYSEAAASRSDQHPKKAGSSKPVPNSTQNSQPPKQVKPVDASVRACNLLCRNYVSVMSCLSTARSLSTALSRQEQKGSTRMLDENSVSYFLLGCRGIQVV